MQTPVSRKPNARRKSRFWIYLILLLIVLFLIRYCSHSKRQNENHALSVVVAVAQKADVPVYLPALGTVTSISTVTVRSQVSGQLLRVLYREGQIVKAGELIAEIDPRPYQALLAQYQGQLARDKALLANARIDLKRYQTLWRQDSISKQVLDTQVATVKQDEGNVAADEGLIETAKVNLIYTRVISPINGRIGLRLVDPGNLVQPSDTTGLAVINTLDPITVEFTLPEDDIPPVLKQKQSGQAMEVKVYDRAQEKLLEVGNLIAIDDQIDSTTGTVKLRAVFPNSHYRLFPNQFVNVRMLVNTLHHATVVPTAAIQYGVNDPFVYVINKDNTVSVKPIVIGVSQDDITTIASGVLPGQSIVIEGGDKLTDGASVTVANPSPAPLHKKSMSSRRMPL